MSRYAVISDVHSNLHALRAVFARMQSMSLDAMVCLGDIVGYGPHPAECIDLVVKHSNVCIRGNHDEAVLDLRLADNFNHLAREAIFWTADAITPLHRDAMNKLKAIEWVDETIQCVHDNPMPGPIDYVHDTQIASESFAGVEHRLCMIGHTHVPMVFEAPAGQGPAQPADVTATVPHDGVAIALDDNRRYIINPGSIGQPRDADSRASFAVLDTDAMTFTVHRVVYDIAAAQAATQAAGLPSILGERLAIGA